jgi:uncharacterized protein (TIGR02271 family)
MNETKRGMLVVGQGGRIGTVEDVMSDTIGTTPRLLVRRDDGGTMLLESNAYQVSGDVVTLSGAPNMFETQRISDVDIAMSTSSVADMAPTATIQEIQAGETVVVPVIREEVHVGRRIVEGGGVRVHKRVEEREEVVEQPTYREEVSVERITIGRPVDEAFGSRQEGDTLIIPVLEEMLVVEKRLVLKEEIRITKRRFEETERASVLVREEHVDIEQIDAPVPASEDRTITASEHRGGSMA